MQFWDASSKLGQGLWSQNANCGLKNRDSNSFETVESFGCDNNQPNLLVKWTIYGTFVKDILGGILKVKPDSRTGKPILKWLRSFSVIP